MHLSLLKQSFELFYLSLPYTTKQGSVLSAYLFILYMNNLVKALLNTNVGCMVESRLINTLVYADDVVLIAPSVSAIKIVLETCESFIYRVSPCSF